MDELRVLSPTAILGYGFPEESFKRGLEENPHVIGVDGGSSDPGPYYLGAGVSFVNRQATKRDLSYILTAAIERKIPLIIGTAGGCGAEAHLNWTREIINEIAAENNLNFTLAVIKADISKELILHKYRENAFVSITKGVNINEELLRKTSSFVAQMGTEPIISALDKANVILAGRCYDPAVFAAVPIKMGYDKGLAIHMGKILECACIAATPGSGSDCIMGYISKESFRVKPLNPERKCTQLSVAAHTLYEKSDPLKLPGPGGVLDLSDTHFKQIGDDTVEVSGSVYQALPYTVKIEGAAQVGYRTISIAGIRDPIMISQLPDIITAVKERTRDNFGPNMPEHSLKLRCYGINGVMGELEPNRDFVPKEVGLVIDVVAHTQLEADSVCGFVRSTMLHYGYNGRIATAGNLAFPFSPSDFHGGEVYEFSIYHIMAVSNPYELFKTDYFEV